MSVNLPPRNPYIAGKAVGGEHGFFGREDIFRLVETVLSSPAHNALVLFGQRRIGKTSILLQLQRRLAAPTFCPIYFDLMDRARQPLTTVLYELAATAASECGLPSPQSAAFDQSDAFHTAFLPSLYQHLDKQTRPVFLFDEFDVLDVAAGEQLPATAAARAFFLYLRYLMEHEPRLAFIFVVGRKAEDLSIDVKATFKAARYQRISVLDDKSARHLIRLVEREGSLRVTDQGVERLLQLTGRHPYFTQLMCQVLFDQAYADAPTDIPTIDVPEVVASIPKVLEASENIFEWIWDGLPSAERIIFSAVASVTHENMAMSEDDLLSLLQGHGIRILIRELELAPKTLVAWEMLRHVDGGYGFCIELMRRWVAERKLLPRVKDELDRVNPIADQHYQLGYTYYRQGDMDTTVQQLHAALRFNPNHLKARLLLGDTLREQGTLAEAVFQLEEAYRYDEAAARFSLIHALLAHSEALEKAGQENDALQGYERVLAISPREVVAREKVEGIQAIQRKRTLEALAVEVATLVQDEAWDKAAEMYGRLRDLDPEDHRWSDGLSRVDKERGLARRYAEGIGALQQQKWSEAQRAFADVVYERPNYKEAAQSLVRALQQDNVPPRTFSSDQPQRSTVPGVFAVHTSSVTSVAFSPAGAVLASGSRDCTVRLWKISDGSLMQEFTGDAAVTSVAFSPEGTMMASTGGNNRVLLWKIWDGTLVREFIGHTDTVLSITLSSDGELLASGGADKTVCLWKTQDGSLTRSLRRHRGTVLSIALSPDGKFLASGSKDKTVRLWKAQDGAFVREYTTHTGAVRSVAFSPDGSLLASGSEDGAVCLWNTQDGALVQECIAHTGAIQSIAFSPDGSLLASGSSDKSIRLWHVAQ